MPLFFCQAFCLKSQKLYSIFELHKKLASLKPRLQIFLNISRAGLAYRASFNHKLMSFALCSLGITLKSPAKTIFLYIFFLQYSYKVFSQFILYVNFEEFLGLPLGAYKHDT